jgi:acetyltransferase-like isoleucine patch superfamily enzyme
MGRLSYFLKSTARSLAYGHKATGDKYVSWLRAQGVRIGNHVHIYSPWTVRIDTQRPWMISIGDNVHISADCSILQHDYSWAVLQHWSGEVLGSCGTVHIGNNVFIGQKCLILKGADVGDNVIIGAGSVVTGALDANSVYAGVPARKLMSINEFSLKRRKAQLHEAVELVHNYEEVYGCKPKEAVLREFFWLFASRDAETLNPVFRDVLDLDAQWQHSSKIFFSSKPLFDSFDEFLQYCELHDESEEFQ